MFEVNLWTLAKEMLDLRKRVAELLEIDYLLTSPPDDLTKEQQQSILTYSSECADEMLVEIPQIFGQLELLGMSFINLMKIKMPEWQKKQWIGE